MTDPCLTSQLTGAWRAYFLSASRISRSKSTSSGVASGAAAVAGADFFKRLICRTMKKMMNAKMMKFSRIGSPGRLDEALSVVRDEPDEFGTGREASNE